MRRQEGSLGCRRAQEREVIPGWAEEVREWVAERAVVVGWGAEGKRIGDVNGLGEGSVSGFRSVEIGDIRPVRFGDLCYAVDDLGAAWPG